MTTLDENVLRLNVGDKITVELDGISYEMTVDTAVNFAYGYKDNRPSEWQIEAHSCRTGKPIYWKQWEDGGHITSHTPAATGSDFETRPGDSKEYWNSD